MIDILESFEQLMECDIPAAPEELIPFAAWVDYIPLRHDTCDECHGMGYTEKTAPEIRKDREGRPYTYRLGSGCPECCGTGTR